MNPEGPHAGDMPNLHVPQNGDLSVEVLNREVTLEKGKPNSLFDSDGSALVIHAKADDYKSDPAGNAGEIRVSQSAFSIATRRQRRLQTKQPMPSR